MSRKQLLQLLSILSLVALTRLLPHPVNVAPMGAIALFSAASFRSNTLRFILPLILTAFTDLLLTLTVNAAYTSPSSYFGSYTTYLMYLSYPLIGLLGLYASKKGQTKQPLRIGAYSLGGSLIFFLLSNFAVWSGGFYGYSWSGLVSCYVAAIPFFHHSILGDLMYNAALFGGLYWLNAYVWKESTAS